jgi:hypothetical protein
MEQVIIGVDPHKLSATIEVVDQQEHLLGSGRFTTDQRGHTAMRSYVKAWPDRVWAVEGANGAGRPQDLQSFGGASWTVQEDGSSSVRIVPISRKFFAYSELFPA